MQAKVCDIDCVEVYTDRNEIPLDPICPDERNIPFVKRLLLVLMTVLLVIALAVRYSMKKNDHTHHPSQSSTANPDPDSNQDQNVNNPVSPDTRPSPLTSIFLSDRMVRNIGNESVVIHESRPLYLSNILFAIHQFSAEFLHLNQSFDTEFKSTFGAGYDQFQRSACWNETFTTLTTQYQQDQLYLINLLKPTRTLDSFDHHQQHSKANSVRSAQILGGYAGGVQLHCNGHVLLRITFGASFVDKKYPSFLDVEDLVDMNVVSAHDMSEKLDLFTLSGEADIRLYLENVQYVRRQYESEINEHLKDYGGTVSIGGSWKDRLQLNTSVADGMYELYLQILLDEMRRCYAENMPVSNVDAGLYLFGSGGGSALDECDDSDILSNVFFYDSFTSSW